MSSLDEDYYKYGAFMTPAQRNQSVYDIHVSQALRQIKRIESERTLLKGHFSLVAKEYYIKVNDLKKVYYE